MTSKTNESREMVTGCGHCGHINGNGDGSCACSSYRPRGREERRRCRGMVDDCEIDELLSAWDGGNVPSRALECALYELVYWKACRMDRDEKSRRSMAMVVYSRRAK